MSAWDHDVHWHTEQTADQAPQALALVLADVRDDHLRVTNGSAEDAYITRLIRIVDRAAHRVTRRSLTEQSFDQVLDRFPAWAIYVPAPPLLSVDAITYIDTNGQEQTLDPSAYLVSAPSGPKAGQARITPAYGTVWPATRAQMDSVTVTVTAGYVDQTVSPSVANIPEDILSGMLLMVGELYKQRSESVQTIRYTPAMIRAKDLWLPYRVFS